jgi:hypothetical protein
MSKVICLFLNTLNDFPQMSSLPPFAFPSSLTKQTRFRFHLS